MSAVQVEAHRGDGGWAARMPGGQLVVAPSLAQLRRRAEALHPEGVQVTARLGSECTLAATRFRDARQEARKWAQVRQRSLMEAMDLLEAQGLTVRDMQEILDVSDSYLHKVRNAARTGETDGTRP